jgi:microcystin-dependent protein
VFFPREAENNIQETALMSEPFLGQLSLVGFNFAPIGWQIANGQILPISQYSALFSLLGTYYGGNGTSNFALPNLQGSIPVGAGQGPGLGNYLVGETGGAINVTLIPNQMPSHTHHVMADTTPANQQTPAGNALAKCGSSAGNLYTTSTTPSVAMNPAMISPYGSSQPHNNMMPYLTMYWIIAMTGVFPARG